MDDRVRHVIQLDGPVCPVMGACTFSLVTMIYMLLCGGTYGRVNTARPDMGPRLMANDVNANATMLMLLEMTSMACTATVSRYYSLFDI